MNQPPDLTTQTIRDFIEATASKNPTPGGGSVAGVVAALAAALGEMSLNFTTGKKAHAEHEDLYTTLAPRLTRCREMFLQLVADDMAAYGMYAEAMKQPQGEDREAAMQLALAAATDVPRELAKLTLALLGDLEKLADKCNKYLVTDLVGAAHLAATVTALCDMNILINTREIDDPQAARDIQAASAADRKKAVEIAANIESVATEWLRN